MLKISVDEGAAFDILSIFQLKIKYADKPVHRAGASDSFLELYNEIASQVGITRLEEILESIEYQELVHANRKTFDLVEMARNKKDGLAKEIDDSNLERYHAKGRLQKRYFRTQLTEVKTRI